MKIENAPDLARIDFEKGDGLVPVIAQDAGTGEVLMLAYADREALRRALETREMWYFSRSRDRLWKKGESSGNVQRLVSLHYDCDADAVLARIEPSGPSCHRGDWSCFGAPPALAALDALIAVRALEPDGDGYTRRLLRDANLRGKKLGEEAVELAMACQSDDSAAVTEEAADLIYHTLVAARAAGVGLAEIAAELERRGGGAPRPNPTTR